MEIDKANSSKLLGQIISEFRKKAGVSQENLCLESGLARSFVSELERGVKQPTINTILIIAKTLGIKPSDLLIELEKRLHWKDH